MTGDGLYDGCGLPENGLGAGVTKYFLPSLNKSMQDQEIGLAGGPFETKRLIRGDDSMLYGGNE